MKILDAILNKITMYRLVVYVLGALLTLAGIFGAFGLVPYNPFVLGYSVAFIFIVCWVANKVFASLFDAPANPESTWITALILSALISPPSAFFDPIFIPLALWSSLWAIGSKYIVSFRGKHIFNPAAFGVAIVSLTLGIGATWWIGTAYLAPFALLGGLLIVRKLRRFDLWWSFIGVFTVGIFVNALFGGIDMGAMFSHSFLYAPAFFFSTIMLTEPLTMPPTRTLRMWYAALTAILFLPNFHIGSFYLSPELALLIGNIFAFAVSPKYKLSLILKDRIQISADSYEFVFAPLRKLHFTAGQYMEWTLPHTDPDSRGIRRYFTVCSAPEDSDVRIGVKFNAPASTFKKALGSMQKGDTIAAGSLAGDFTLPRDAREPLVFIAGGIGITPFRSMLEHMLIAREHRPVTLLYSNKTAADIAYLPLLQRAERELGVKTIYVNTEETGARVNGEMIAKEIPDHQIRTFYISGPQQMVAGLAAMLRSLGTPRSRIKTDYFPGFA